MPIAKKTTDKELRTTDKTELSGFTLVFILTFVYFFIELTGGLYYNSLALVTDAAFMAINLAGQLIASYAKRLSRKPPDKNQTFGYENFDHAKKVKELHLWSLVPEKTIMAVKIRTEGRVYDREKIKTLKTILKEKFGIYDVYVEVYEED